MEAHLLIVTIFAVLSALICIGIVIWVIYKTLKHPPIAPRAPTAPTDAASDILEPRPPRGPQQPPHRPLSNLWTDSQPQDLEYGFLEQDLEEDLGLVYGVDCAVCNDIMDGHATITKIKRCNHSFHKQCIGQWYQAQASSAQPISCPICRGPVTKQHIFIKMRDLTTA